jgi:hypothetical protein
MELRRNYMRPFWWLLVLFVLKLAMFLILLNSISQSTMLRPYLRSIVPPQVIILVVLIAEIVTYWYMRKWQYRRFFVKWHIGLWYAAILLAPLAFVIIQYSSMWLPPDAHSNAHLWLKRLSSIFAWSCYIVGHIFFAGAIMEGIKNRRNEQLPEESEIFR